MATVTYSSIGTITTVLSTGLNSLANNGAALSASLATSGYRWARFTFTGTFASATTANTGVSLYAIQSTDGGTTWEDGGASVIPATAPIGVFGLRAVSGTQVRVIFVQIPAGPNLKFLAYNNGTGQAMASSGNTITMELFTEVIA